jgi:oxaloacetate decarboxylase alpha subunit
MNFKEIKELISIFSAETAIDELEIERSGTRVRFKRAGSASAAGPIASPNAGVPEPTPTVSAMPESPAAEDHGLVDVTSPIVGTFYRASSPDGEPFVSVGDSVEKGQTVCIIEAMKLMNEIEAESSGDIVSIFVENGQPVEYGERLFAIRPR